MQTPNILVIDCDGVLTDGTLTIDCKGEKLFKKFHTRDVRAIRQFVASGYEVYIVTADDWDGTMHFAEKVGAHCKVLKDKSRVAEMLHNRPYIAVGDDAWDVPMIAGATHAYCPANADTVVKATGAHVLKSNGGEGVIAELLWLMEESKNAHS